MIIKRKKSSQEKPVENEIKEVQPQVVESQEEFDFFSVNFEAREERRKGNRKI